MGMDDFVRRFIRSSLIWLGVGVLMGMAMVLMPNPALLYRPAHMHANLLGFVSMMIFGVAYHVIPRFSGNPLHSRTMARVHVVVANAGLALMVGGFVLRVHGFVGATWILGTGAVASVAGAFLFITNIWRTLGGEVRPAVTSAGAAPSGRADPNPTKGRISNVAAGA